MGDPGDSHRLSSPSPSSSEHPSHNTRNIPPSLPPAPPATPVTPPAPPGPPPGRAPVNGVGVSPGPVIGPPRLVKIIFLSAPGSVLATSRLLRDSRDGDLVVTRKIGGS